MLGTGVERGDQTASGGDSSNGSSGLNNETSGDSAALEDPNGIDGRPTLDPLDNTEGSVGDDAEGDQGEGEEEPGDEEEEEDEDPRDGRITLYLTMPDRPVGAGELFHARLEIDVNDLEMTAYAATIYFDQSILQVVEVQDVPGSLGVPHAAASNAAGFLTVSERNQARTATGRIPLADVLWQVVGSSGGSSELEGTTSVVDLSTGRPERIRNGVFVVNRHVTVQ